MQFAMAAASPVAIRSRRAEVCALGDTPCRLLLLALLSCRNAVVRECTEAELSHVDPSVAIAGAMAVLLSAVPFSWAAISTYLNTAHAKRTGGAFALHQRSKCQGWKWISFAVVVRYRLSSICYACAGDMYWHLLTPLAVCTVGLIMLAFTLAHHPLLAFFALTLSATSQASNPLEWG